MNIKWSIITRTCCTMLFIETLCFHIRGPFQKSRNDTLKSMKQPHVHSTQLSLCHRTSTIYLFFLHFYLALYKHHYIQQQGEKIKDTLFILRYLHPRGKGCSLLRFNYQTEHRVSWLRVDVVYILPLTSKFYLRREFAILLRAASKKKIRAARVISVACTFPAHATHTNGEAVGIFGLMTLLLRIDQNILFREQNLNVIHAFIP